ncbi:MAG: chemotaxis protein CheW [Acidiferrobacteraceae bacterium]
MSQAVEQVHVLLIALRDASLVIPSAMVAEVIPVPERLAPVPLAEPWVLGVFAWRSRPVPVISINHLLGMTEPETGRRSRVVVFYPLAGSQTHDFFAVPSAVEPQPRLLEDGRDFAQMEMTRNGVLLETRLGTAKAFIPDVEALRQRLYPAVA